MKKKSGKGKEEKKQAKQVRGTHILEHRGRERSGHKKSVRK
jgi:hypothetical protein